MTMTIRMQIGETVVSWGALQKRAPKIANTQCNAWPMFAIVERGRGPLGPTSEHSRGSALSLAHPIKRRGPAGV